MDILIVKILLVVSTHKRLEELIGLSEAFLDRGHKVTIFFVDEGVNLNKAFRRQALNCNILVCRTSAERFKVDTPVLQDDSSMSSLGGLVERVEENDRVVFLG